ncbi:SIR2 family protein [Paenibacillus sp. MZ04-78.2]|uniref:SIR2 family NAD-dependent protein deacylase n=1 Tax=Paenibacillus sp. MZ04-78.2 TaxID=2962034 RepID=UPI0020B6F981|nr:SIR2 family protein [Paenibacillus sp. MZ04-78.2]MCP3774341.1 SIR2 family protein [Paenibacillus sp. MZ04-78.2]
MLRELEEFLSKEFQKEAYSEFIDEGDFFGGLDYLLDKSLYISNEDQLKDEIIKIIIKANLGIDESEHNFYDFVELKADFYITTNYDLLMEHFLTDAGDYNTPICMDEIGNLRNMSTSGNSIIHLHGHINRKSSMIVTKKDYTKLYSKKGTLVQLSVIVGSRPLLFIGYSFKDKFFVQMYEKLIEILQTDHYLVLFNPDTKEIKELNKKNIKVIGLSVTDGNYAKAIKVLINYIKRKGL